MYIRYIDLADFKVIVGSFGALLSARMLGIEYSSNTWDIFHLVEVKVMLDSISALAADLPQTWHQATFVQKFATATVTVVVKQCAKVHVPLAFFLSLFFERLTWYSMPNYKIAIFSKGLVA